MSSGTGGVWLSLTGTWIVPTFEQWLQSFQGPPKGDYRREDSSQGHTLQCSPQNPVLQREAESITGLVETLVSAAYIYFCV